MWSQRSPSRVWIGFLRDVHDDAAGEDLAIARLEGVRLIAGEEVDVAPPEEIGARDAEQRLPASVVHATSSNPQILRPP